MAIVNEGQVPEADTRPAASSSAIGVRSESYQPAFPSSTEFFANPLSAIRRIHDDMDRIFAQAWGGNAAGVARGEPVIGGDTTAWSPAIEIKQRGDSLVVYAELPGLKPEEVRVEVTHNTLVIQGERRREQTSAEGGLHHTERSYGRFYRAIPLPGGANAERATAAVRDGVLEVIVPYQPQQLQRRQIPIAGDAGSLARRADEQFPRETIPRAVR
jgi:HSP20 family protein